MCYQLIAGSLVNNWSTGKVPTGEGSTWKLTIANW